MHSLNLRNGFTLVELMVGVSVFALAAAGIAATTLMTSRISTSNISRNTAYTVAQGYAEQIKSIDFESIIKSIETGVPLGTKSLSTVNGVVTSIDDPLTFDTRTQKNIIVDIEDIGGGNTRDRIMNFWITPSARNLLSSDGLNVVEVTLDFEWESSGGGSNTLYSGYLNLVKTNVPSF